MSARREPAPGSGRGKSPYRRPRLRIIDLQAEEVLGIGCKGLAGDAPFARPCNSNNCRQLGT